MKSWTILFVISAVATIGVLGVDVKEALEKCIKETNVTREALKDYKEGKSSNDRGVQCFIACMAKEEGWMAENGDFILEQMVDPPLSRIPRKDRSEVEKILQSCITAGKKGKDICETAYLVSQCLDANMGKEEQ